MNIYVITENYYLFSGIVNSLSSKLDWEFIQLNPQEKSNVSIFELSGVADIYILAPGYSRIDFSMLVALNNTKSSVIVASNHSDWNAGNMFRFSILKRAFYLSDLLQCIYTLRPSTNKTIFLPKITTSERQVLLMTQKGLSINLIGSRLNVTVKTAYAHQRNVLKKLGVRKVRDIISLPNHFIEYVCGNHYICNDKIK